MKMKTPFPGSYSFGFRSTFANAWYMRLTRNCRVSEIRVGSLNISWT